MVGVASTRHTGRVNIAASRSGFDAGLSVKKAAVVMGIGVALMWVLELIDTVLLGSLDQFGVTPRRFDELPQIYTAPWLHFGWDHLISNTLPFFLLGFVIVMESVRRWLVSMFSAITSSGLTVWLLSPPRSVTAGESGLIFGWLSYLLVRGIFSRDIKQILLAVAVFALYGGVLWGVLPTNPEVSWQGHLGGAIGGILAAWWLHARDQRS